MSEILTEDLPWDEFVKKFTNKLNEIAKEEPTIIHYPMLVWVELGPGKEIYEKEGKKAFMKAFHVQGEKMIDLFYGPSTEEEKDAEWKDAQDKYNKKHGTTDTSKRPAL